jgi:hypothetical protein
LYILKYIIGIGCHSEVVYSILKLNGTNGDIKFLSYPSEVDTEGLSATIKDNYAGGLDKVPQDRCGP